MANKILKYINFFQHENRRTWLVVLWLLLLCLLSYGLLIPFLGFYWDAIPYLYQYHTFGAEGFPAFVANDRPFSAWIFMLTTTLFGYHPLGYHLLALAIRFLTSLLFFKILKAVYPEHPGVQFAAASLFAVYPGFLQQPIAFIYIHHLGVLCLFLASLFWMIKAYQSAKPHFLYLGLSLLSALSIFFLENFAFLELARPFILWKVMQPEPQARRVENRRVAVRWLPYLLIFAGFLIWRVFIIQFPSYQPTFFESLSQDFWGTTGQLLLRLPKDLVTVTLGVWVETLQAPSSDLLSSSTQLVYWALVLVVFVLALLLQFLLKDFRKIESSPHIWHILLHGIMLFFLAGGIVWALEFPVAIRFPWDRMTLAFMPAAAILLGGCYALLSKKRILRSVALALLVALAVGEHFENGMRYRQEWKSFHAFMWQLKWRIPELKEDTLLVTDHLPLQYYSDNSLSFAFNWMFEVPEMSYDLPYLIQFSEARLGGSLRSLDPHTEISQNFRNFKFSGSTDRMILFYHDPPGCMHVIDPELDADNPLVPAAISNAVGLSRLDLIRDDAPEAVQWEILEQSDTSWCYYYQKASLAVQMQQWEQAAQLGDIAFRLDEYPNDASERLPFIEAYAMSGAWEKALAYSRTTLEISELNRPMLCTLWQRIDSNLPDSQEKTVALNEIAALSGCQP